MKSSASVDHGATRRLFSVLTAVWDTDLWRLELWDGSSAGETETPEFVLRFRSRRGLDRLVGDLPDRGFGRAYAEGSLEVEGLYAFLGRVSDLSMSRMARLLPRILTTALALGARPDPRRIPPRLLPFRGDQCQINHGRADRRRTDLGHPHDTRNLSTLHRLSSETDEERAQKGQQGSVTPRSNTTHRRTHPLRLHSRTDDEIAMPIREFS